MKVYISGPMSGLPDNNRKAFAAVAKKLRADSRFTEVVSPAELDHVPDATWADFMRRDIAELVKCDAIYMLPGWHNSKGAQIERQLAFVLGIDVQYAELCRHGEICGIEDCEEIGLCPHSEQLP